MRTKQIYIVHDREPETDRYCVRCRRDILPGAKAREIHLVDGGTRVLHPKDEPEYEAGRPDDLGLHLIGPSCARRLGLMWSIPEGG